MANKTYMTSSDLLSSVKRRGNIPDTQDMITDDEILEFANEEMLLNLIPLIYSKHESYYLRSVEIPLESGLIRYPIPYRGIGAKVREIYYKSSSGDVSPMMGISVDDLSTGVRSGNESDSVFNYHFEGEEIVLYTSKTANLTGSIVVFYFLRPNALVKSNRVGIIENILNYSTPGYKQIYLESFPDAFLTGGDIDFIKTKSPHRVVEYDISMVSINSNNKYVVIAESDIPSSIGIGDRIALAGETDIVNAPSDMHVLLAQYTVERVLEAIGDNEGLKNASAKSAKMEQNANAILANRNIGSPTKVRVRNGTIGNASRNNRWRG
jgi:hypothetical protein